MKDYPDALWWAARDGREEVVALLLEHDTSLDSGAALIEAVKFDRRETAELLIDKMGRTKAASALRKWVESENRLDLTIIGDDITRPHPHGDRCRLRVETFLGELTTRQSHPNCRRIER